MLGETRVSFQRNAVVEHSSLRKTGISGRKQKENENKNAYGILYRYMIHYTEHVPYSVLLRCLRSKGVLAQRQHPPKSACTSHIREQKPPENLSYYGGGARRERCRWRMEDVGDRHVVESLLVAPLKDPCTQSSINKRLQFVLDAKHTAHYQQQLAIGMFR